MKTGDYVIINTIDAPEAKMVAVLTRHDDRLGIWHALYLWDKRTMRRPYGTLPTLVEDFGKMVHVEGNQFRVVDNGKEGVATYEDGKPRRWQDHTGTPWRTMHPTTHKWISALSRARGETP